MSQGGANSMTVYPPPATAVVVKGFTNATDLQRITVLPPAGSPSVFQGTGEQNTPIGVTHFTTPPGGQPTVTITIDHSADGGRTWQPSDVFLDACSVQAYQLVVIVSEDADDSDDNDAICMVSWPHAQS